MKRLFISIVAIALSLCAFGCTTESSSSSASSEVESVTDMHSITSPVSEPPIACTKNVDFENISITIPEEWNAEVGVDGNLKVYSGDDISGTITVQESDISANNSDEELMTFVNDRLGQAENFTIDEGFKVMRSGDFAYVIVPFTGVRSDQGSTQEFYGYSLCGFANELIIAEFSCFEDNKDVLTTFHWILENLQVN